MDTNLDEYDDDQLLNEIQKEVERNEKEHIEDTKLDDEAKHKLLEAAHAKLMLADNDGEIHRVEEIDFIIKDILKHQNKVFKCERVREDAKETLEVDGVTEVNDTIESREFIAHDSASLAYTNAAVVKNQRSTLLYLAKKIGVNLLTGKSIMNISLPIKIFEPRSFLEKVAGDFRFAPYYLGKAMETTDPVERVRVMTTWHVCSLQLEPQMLKPFNPILGETFQGMIGDYDVAIEQISHHPPISAFQVWKSNDPNAPYIDGYLAFEASTGISAIIGFKKGEIRIHFPDSGQKIYSHTFQE